ncbi:polysaccharide pyruvyl transferase family protein [Boseongicola aestuarii]|uniref:Colanic acid biosynthesis protein n=1 Tax=Boseongicola aestuarii TaxID=1470561 RepID=A0A238J1Q4_9RHOB|nr:polysaccharide pyruvyl transferase family protein [Boseongicola aestuarii]SMX24253.1 colanic acid biosynthesis protein [Boseongicola aestuarii]
MSRPVTLALVWHQMNSDNLGVGALTLANLAILRAAAAQAGREVQFLIVGWKDPRPWYETPHNVENVALRLRHLVMPFGPLGEAFSRADAVFDIGGGDSFTDIYGKKRFFTVWGTKARALAKGLPLILSPQTIGPFKAGWSRRLACFVMNRSAAVVSRDAPSTAFLSDLGIHSRVLEATDVAMRLPYEPAPVRTDGKIRVGLNVSGLLMSGGYDRNNQFGLAVDYPALIREVIKWFQAQDGVEVHLIGHVQSKVQPIEDDQRASAALAAEFSGTVLAPIFASPVDAKSYIAGMDFFMGARMHATIAAFSTGVPVIPMAYSRKFHGVFATLGYDHVANLKTDCTKDILARIKNGFETRDALSLDIESGMSQVDARLAAYQTLATQIIRDL